MRSLDGSARSRWGPAAILAAVALSACFAVSTLLPVSPAPPTFDGAVVAAVGTPERTRTDPLPTTAVHAVPSLATVPAARRPTRPTVAVPEPKPRVVQRTGSDSVLVPAGWTAAFLGDSYTTGWNGAGLGARGWPRIVAAAKGWRVVNLAVAGTGFVNPGWTNQPVGTRVAAAIRANPDIVFVAAGHNDSRWSVSTTATAARSVIERLHNALPNAVIVVVAPIWQDGSPPARCLGLRDRLRTMATGVGATFIDPLAEGWFAGSAQRFIGPDGIHPTDAGHTHIAARVLTHLR
jgi:lysophospholipase L1-like esterase